MKKKAIIHISDLHVSLHENLKGIANEVNSWLTTDLDDNNTENYINAFCAYIKSSFVDYDLYLIITGDITNESHKKENEIALSVVNNITSELKIDREKLLIVPGDHDINRRKCEDAFEEGSNNEKSKRSYEYNKEKYNYFCEFYKGVFDEEFKINDVIVNTITFPQDEIILLGMNSNYFIDYEGGLGAFDCNHLREELVALEYKYNKYSKIAVCHHNIYGAFENIVTGQWDVENRREVFKLLQEYNFKCIFAGNEHTRGSEKKDQLYYSDSGSFATIDPMPSFKVYEIDNSDGNLSLKHFLGTLQKSGNINEDPWGNWSLQNIDDFDEVEKFVLIDIPKEQIVERNILGEIIQVDDLVIEKGDDSSLDIEEDKFNIAYNNFEYSNLLLKVIKEKELLHSGHFHWSETSRANNWINTSKLIQDRGDLQMCRNAIKDVIKSCKLADKFDFVVGLGMEGNILSTNLSMKYEKPFSFLPYSYRYNEHGDYEKKLNYTNSEGKYKTVLVITDVVHDGRTIRKLIHKSEKDFFNIVEKIIVISLLYTGADTTNSIDRLNTEGLEDLDRSTDHEESRIDFYSVLHLKSNKCPYRNNFRNECLIYKNKLDHIHKFYDEKKVLEKSNK